MPRQARIDAPGALHHIIFRGIERKKIFRDDTDRDRFVERIGGILKETSTRCYAWALIPNHVHLLLRARAKITSHFGIPSSDHLRPRLNREILEIVRLFLWFLSIGAAKSDPKPGANSANLFLREP